MAISAWKSVKGTKIDLTKQAKVMPPILVLNAAEKYDTL